MNEDVIVESTPTDTSSNEEIILNVNDVNLSVKEILQFLENEKKEEIKSKF